MMRIVQEACRQSAIVCANACVKLTEFRNNPEIFQKICQIACAIFLVQIERNPSSSFSQLASAFSTAGMQDFYRLFKLPKHLLFPIDVSRIDEHALLQSLQVILCDHFQVGYQVDSDGSISKIQDDNMEPFAKAGMNKQLQVMAKTGDSYKSTDEFKAVLQKRFAALKTIRRDRNGVDVSYNFESLDLGQLHVPIIPLSFTEKLESTIWHVANSGCLLLYLREWGIAPIAEWSEKLGAYPGLSLMKRGDLESTLRLFICTAYLLKLFEAVKKLRSNSLPLEERRNARWMGTASFAEIIFNGSAFLHRQKILSADLIVIQSMAIIAKGIGIIEVDSRVKSLKRRYG